MKDKVIVGVGGGEYGIRGFIAAYDVATGKEVWRFYTDSGAGRAGLGDVERRLVENRRRLDLGDRHLRSVAQSHLLGRRQSRSGLQSRRSGPATTSTPNSVVALDADTGTLKWHFQFTPNDAYDWDAIQVPVLVDATWRGAPAKLLMAANRNGFFYVLDRVTGKFLVGKPFIKVNWASGLDDNGRPIQTPQPAGAADVSGTAGRHELVVAGLQSAHGPVLRRRLGGRLRRLHAAAGNLQARRRVHGRQLPRDAADARLGRVAEHRPAADQHVDGRHVARRAHRDRSRHRRSQVDVPDVRPDRKRRDDDRVGSRVHRRPRRLSAWPSTRAPASCSGR